MKRQPPASTGSCLFLASAACLERCVQCPIHGRHSRTAIRGFSRLRSSHLTSQVLTVLQHCMTPNFGDKPTTYGHDRSPPRSLIRVHATAMYNTLRDMLLGLVKDFTSVPENAVVAELRGLTTSASGSADMKRNFDVPGKHVITHVGIASSLSNQQFRHTRHHRCLDGVLAM